MALPAHHWRNDGITYRSVAVLDGSASAQSKDPPLDWPLVSAGSSCGDCWCSRPLPNDDLRLGIRGRHYGFGNSVARDNDDGVCVYPEETGRTSQGMDDPRLRCHFCFCYLPHFERLRSHLSPSARERPKYDDRLGLLGRSFGSDGNDFSGEAYEESTARTVVKA